MAGRPSEWNQILQRKFQLKIYGMLEIKSKIGCCKPSENF